MEERVAGVVGERSPLEGADPRLPRSRPARPSGETLPADRRRRARRRYLGKAPDDGGHRLQRHSRGRLHEVRHHPGHTRTRGPVRHRDRQRRPVGAHQAGTDLPGHMIATAGSGGRRGDRRPSAPSLSAPGHHPGDVRAGVRERRPRRCTHPRPAPVRHLAPHAKEPPPMTPQHLVLSADRLLPADPTTRGIARDLLAEVRTPRSSPPQARPAGAADRRRRLLRPDESPADPRPLRQPPSALPRRCRARAAGGAGRDRAHRRPVACGLPPSAREPTPTGQHARAGVVRRGTHRAVRRGQ